MAVPATAGLVSTSSSVKQPSRMVPPPITTMGALRAPLRQNHLRRSMPSILFTTRMTISKSAKLLS
ncbi:unnamed protein product [Acanthoscelides obtectus]|uniref:Uncharacterized protein n=1 Tax=Acanthoscelides obtectus TaxID=200917 RepID=A0A9P0KJ20_ACAOB|nr:unnamed protein product [Acanthoscelides obtectus]CAK1651944.1 hypothetical protein AOBTE_LOCUS17566 [Acanthoscelides obtectus]